MLITLISIGIITGFLSGLLGIGGGVIMVPLLTILAGLPQHLAQGISILVIIPTSLVALWHLQKKKLVDYPSAFLFAAGSIVGAIISSYLVQYIDGNILKKVFSIFIIFTGLKMMKAYFKTKKQA